MVDRNGSSEACAIAGHVVNNTAILTFAGILQPTPKARDQRVEVNRTILMQLGHNEVAQIGRVHALTVKPHRHDTLAAIQVVPIIFLWVEGEGTKQLKVVADHEIGNCRFCAAERAMD